jgi:hypothetical protein
VRALGTSAASGYLGARGATRFQARFGGHSDGSGLAAQRRSALQTASVGVRAHPSNREPWCSPPCTMLKLEVKVETLISWCRSLIDRLQQNPRRAYRGSGVIEILWL